MNNAFPHRIAFAALTVSLSLGSAQAAIFKDAQLESLQETGKYAELEQQARARLEANAADAEARAALSLALSFLDPGDVKRIEAGAQQAKLCTEQHPAVAVCHLAGAQNLGQQLLNMGMVRAMRSVGTLKDAWIRTLELDPSSFTARVQLAKLYVTLPGLMGGRTSRARELEAAVRVSQPETARIIRVHIAGEAEEWAAMESELHALKGARDAAMLGEIREATLQLARAYLTDEKDLPKAKRVYETLVREQPSRAEGYYGLGRVHIALGQLDEGIRLFERARSLAGANEVPIDHRLGDAYLTKGEKAQAKAAYERFVANKRANPANLEEVRNSLARLD
jgi:tetratricopeptide (TPR) repeat protein